MRLRILHILLPVLVALNCLAQKPSRNQQDAQLLADNVFHLSEVMLHDIAAPVAASRFYAYALLGAYEAAYYGNTKLPNLNEKFRSDPQFKSVPVPPNFNMSFAANYAMLHVGRFIMPSGFLLEENQKQLIQHFRKKRRMSDDDIRQHVGYAEGIANQVVAFAKTDGYNKLSTYPRYTPKKQDGYWYPTPPEYMGALEPQWKTVRPFYLDSAAQFSPAPPTPFSKNTSSEFYKLLREVYDLKNNLTDEQREIANFWDCNPFAVDYSGHMAIGLKKISPGGHWLSITGIACRKADISLDSTILIHVAVATTLHDAFISCWHEKYKSDRIRPETAINNLLDPSWRPLLQTPPFPEYTSGHSVASSSVAVVLTHFLGDNFEFVDTSEVYFGLPARPFRSFLQAADEAAISRVYGGIHYRDACDQGVIQGKQIGQYVVGKMFGAQAWTVK